MTIKKRGNPRGLAISVLCAAFVCAALMTGGCNNGGGGGGNMSAADRKAFSSPPVPGGPPPEAQKMIAEKMRESQAKMQQGAPKAQGR